MLHANWIRSSKLTLAIATCIAMSTGAMAQTQYAKECSLAELPAITLIEDHGERGNVSADRLADASLTVLDARTACAGGRVREALAMYQSVLELGPAQRSASVPSTLPR